MFTPTRGLALLGALSLVAACAPRPVPVTWQPVYNKYGGVVGCEDGNGNVTTAAPLPCLPPPGCQYTPGAAPCDPGGGQTGREPDPTGGSGGRGNTNQNQNQNQNQTTAGTATGKP